MDPSRLPHPYSVTLPPPCSSSSVEADTSTLLRPSVVPNPYLSPTISCSNCGYFWSSSLSTDQHPTSGQQILTRNLEIYSAESQIWSPLFRNGYDSMGQPVASAKGGDWLPDTEEPFDFGLDLNFREVMLATNLRSWPLQVKGQVRDGGGGDLYWNMTMFDSEKATRLILVMNLMLIPH